MMLPLLAKVPTWNHGNPGKPTHFFPHRVRRTVPSFAPLCSTESLLGRRSPGSIGSTALAFSKFLGSSRPTGGSLAESKHVLVFMMLPLFCGPCHNALPFRRDSTCVVVKAD